MVEGIKVGGVWFSLCVPIYVPIMGDFIEFEYLKSAFDPTRLKKALLLGCRGGISFFVRVKYPIIKF
ncbi:hypothetical protein TH0144_10190 [Helicobacter pylori]